MGQSEASIMLLHLLSLNETARLRGEPMVEVNTDSAGAWGELSRIGAIDESGAITAVGREILGEVQPPSRGRSV